MDRLDHKTMCSYNWCMFWIGVMHRWYRTHCFVKEHIVLWKNTLFCERTHCFVIEVIHRGESPSRFSHTYTYTHTHTHTHTRFQTCVQNAFCIIYAPPTSWFVYVCGSFVICIYVSMYICVNVLRCMHVCGSLRMRVCMWTSLLGNLKWHRTHFFRSDSQTIQCVLYGLWVTWMSVSERQTETEKNRATLTHTHTLSLSKWRTDYTQHTV